MYTYEMEPLDTGAKSRVECSFLAFGAFTCGVTAIVLWWLWLPAPLLSVIAVLSGLLGLRAIRWSDDQLGGRRLAVSGIVLGLGKLLLVLGFMLNTPEEKRGENFAFV